MSVENINTTNSVQKSVDNHSLPMLKGVHLGDPWLNNQSGNIDTLGSATRETSDAVYTNNVT